MRVIIHSAAIQDRDGAALIFEKAHRRFNWLEPTWVESGYRAQQVDEAAAKAP
jgi:hypothetical protein